MKTTKSVRATAEEKERATSMLVYLYTEGWLNNDEYNKGIDRIRKNKRFSDK